MLARGLGALTRWYARMEPFLPPGQSCQPPVFATGIGLLCRGKLTPDVGLQVYGRAVHAGQALPVTMMACRLLSSQTMQLQRKR